MLEWSHLAIILGMAITTYLTRIIGFFLLRNRKLSTRTQFVLDNIAGCVMLSIIAPVFVSGEPATLLGLIATLLASMWFSLLPTVLIGVGITGLSRYVLGG
ncbi:TPA: AzlD family protein [Acinetobacter baumannii]|uniref:AzlD family protein n=1 Tax=Acinetobacter baumannii TaxID=470 RepID=UPI000BF8058E|nr:AzlD family protein [Acinetobacter baumannii]MDC4326523.1 AzlD family protein [Acinetobacter baumannii]MDC4392803.1 AzlD family protein [Acinetobacter baumannii]MDC5450773.1 AzlD family protein [Acinetobacter baumannii]MDV7468087.1 AzlD family protein [Acinetobacter baumannii]HCA5369772.1 AzlD family protein [Acinetobacter baumannii]